MAEKIFVKLNPEKGGSFYQDPTESGNMISTGEIKEFTKSVNVQKIINAGGLTILSKDDEQVQEYVANLKKAKAASSKKEAESVKALKSELTDLQLSSQEQAARIVELEATIKGLQEENQSLHDENEKLLNPVPEEKGK